MKTFRIVLALATAGLAVASLSAQTANQAAPTPATPPTAPSAPASPAAPSAPAVPVAPPAPAAAAPTIENSPGFTVLGYAVTTTRQQEEGGNGQVPQLWQTTLQNGALENVPHRADEAMTVVYTNYTPAGQYEYVLGVKVTAVDKVPDGMISIVVPAGKYAVVDSATGSLPDVIPAVWQRIMAMPASELGGDRAYKTDFESYPPDMDWQNAQVAVHLGLK